jgi:hypothetical protein
MRFAHPKPNLRRMTEDQRLIVFRSQTKNVRELKSAWTHVNRVINALFLQNNLTAVHTQTKILALIYCALAEAVFSKLIHTPNGLTLDEIRQIKDVANAQGVKVGWIKCAELAVRRVDGSKSNYQPNVIKRLSSLIEEFIFDPSLLRNKLAHGQWSVALNRDNTAVNEESTREINDCTVIDLYCRVYSLDRLAAIIEDIVESPNKAHPRDYWEYLSEIEQGQKQMSTWTVERKIEQLRNKKSHKPPEGK